MTSYCICLFSPLTLLFFRFVFFSLIYKGNIIALCSTVISFSCYYSRFQWKLPQRVLVLDALSFSQHSPLYTVFQVCFIATVETLFIIAGLFIIVNGGSVTCRRSKNFKFFFSSRACEFLHSMSLFFQWGTVCV